MTRLIARRALRSSLDNRAESVLASVVISFARDSRYHGSNPAVGFLAQAAKYRTGIAAGEIVAPAKSIEQMQQIATNSYVNTGLTALFLFVVFSVLVYAIGAVRKARANPQRSDRETPYVAVDPALAARL